MSGQDAGEFDERLLVERGRRGDGVALQRLAGRYRKPVFGFVLSLLGCGRNDAREMTIGALSSAFQSLPGAPRGASVWRQVLPPLLSRCRSWTGQPEAGLPEGLAAGPEQRALLHLIRQAVLSLPFDARAAVLLRDQLHIPYDDIGAVVRADAKQARADVTGARTRLREQLRTIAGRQRI
jgi:DNA-directed RNA polymerase specialized sigma24 family protein